MTSLRLFIERNQSRHFMIAPIIEIGIPCYNASSFLNKLMDSLLNQTYKDFTILLVDDGSADNTAEIIDSYTKADPDRIRAIIKENEGISATRNLMIRSSIGEYITFIDSDDYVKEDFVETLVSEIDSNDVLLTGRVKVDEYGKPMTSLLYGDSLINQRYLTTHGVLYKLSYLRTHDITFPENKIYEDNPFSLHAIFRTTKVKTLPYCGYYQLVRNGSITSKKLELSSLPLTELEETIKLIREENLCDMELFDATFLGFLTYFVFKVNREHLKNKDNRKSDKATMRAIHDYSVRMVNTYFTGASSNKYIRFLKDTKVRKAQRLGSWGLLRLIRMKLLWPAIFLYYGGFVLR